MRTAAGLVIALTLGTYSFTPTTAHALYEVCNPYSLQDFRDQLDAMEAAFEEFDLNEARYQAETAEKMARCISEPVSPEDVARFARDRARMFFFDSKNDRAANWMLVALAATGTLPAEIGEEDPLRLVLREVMMEDHAPAKLEGHVVPPAKGAILHNGRLVEQPTGFEGVLGLIQVFDKKGNYVEGFWLSGADWRGDVESTFVSADAPPPATPKWFEGENHSKAPDLAKAFAAATGMESDDLDLELDLDVGGDSDGTPDTTPPDTTADSDGSDAVAVGPTKPEDPKPPKPPKPPKDKSNGPKVGLLASGVGVAAVGGALWGAGAALNTAPASPYTADELVSRRTTVNVLGLSGMSLVAVGTGLFTVSIATDGNGLRLRGKF